MKLITTIIPIKSSLIFVIVVSMMSFLMNVFAEKLLFIYSGEITGSSIFKEGTPFRGYFSYEFPQSSNSNGLYLLDSYEFIVQGHPLPVSDYIIPEYPLTGESWNFIPVNNLTPSLGIRDELQDKIRINLLAVFDSSLSPGRIRAGNLTISITDDSSTAFSGNNLVDFASLTNAFNGGHVNFSYSIDGGSSYSQSGILLSFYSATRSVDTAIVIESSSNLNDDWQREMIGPEMITTDGVILLDPASIQSINYRLHIQAVERIRQGIQLLITQ